MKFDHRGFIQYVRIKTRQLRTIQLFSCVDFQLDIFDQVTGLSFRRRRIKSDLCFVREIFSQTFLVLKNKSPGVCQLQQLMCRLRALSRIRTRYHCSISLQEFVKVSGWLRGSNRRNTPLCLWKGSDISVQCSQMVARASMSHFRGSCLRDIIVPSKLFGWLLKVESFV